MLVVQEAYRFDFHYSEAILRPYCGLILCLVLIVGILSLLDFHAPAEGLYMLERCCPTIVPKQEVPVSI